MAPLAALVLAACAGKAPPAAPAGFAEPDGMRHNPDLPFHRVWRDRGFDFAGCRRLHVAPVDTDYLMENTWWSGFGRGGHAEADVGALAERFRARVTAAFRDDPVHRFAVVDERALAADPDRALILELAIVELVPHKAVLHALSYPGGPVGLLARRGLDTLDATRIAIEGRVRDAASGAIVARFADREQKKSGLLNLKNFTWYAHVHEILDEWAEQFRQVASKAPDDVVPDTPAWEWLPW